MIFKPSPESVFFHSFSAASKLLAVAETFMGTKLSCLLTRLRLHYSLD